MAELNNNDLIIDRLLWEQKQLDAKDFIIHADKQTDTSWDNQVSISSSRVMDIRYRIYFLIALVLFVVLGLYVVLPGWDVFQSTQASLQAINLQVDNFATKKLKMDADKALIAKMASQESLIVSCLNQRVGCQDIDQSIRNNFSFARSYIQLNNLSDPKMLINEKVLLANINWYLLQDSDGSSNGNITQIVIGEPKQFMDNLRYVPLKLTISFQNKDSLLSFLDNVEKKILPDPEYRVLYKIDKVSYDIANYTTQQSVGIDLNAYYYTD